MSDTAPARVRIAEGDELAGLPDPPKSLFPGDHLHHDGKRYMVIYVWAWLPSESPVERHVLVKPAGDSPVPETTWDH